MAKFSSSKQSKKDSVEQGSAPARKKPMSKKRSGGAQGDDDESVDSHGNIRGLLAYDDEESWDEEEEDTPSDLTRKSERERRMLSTRNSKKKADSQKKKKAAQKVVESDDSSSEEEVVPRKRRGFAPKRRLVKEEDEDEEEDEDYDEEDEEDERHAGLLISFDTGEQSENRMIPKRHNMKKETVNVKKFVELVTKPHVEGGIDEQIDEFKRLSAEKQTELLLTLDRKVTAESKSQSMMFRILDMKLTPETQSMVLAKYNALQTMDPGSGEYFKQRAWLEKFASIPLGVYKEIPVKISDGTDTCGAFMERARKYLGEAIYGQNEAKIQILQFIASKIANPDGRGLSLLLAGPPGIGKTSLIKNGVAKALQWPFQFISLGGDSDASSYVGHQVVYEGSHCGKIVNSVIGAKSMSMVLMFDELDKISATAKGEEIQNLLVHLTDPVQNADFEDKYLSGIPIDLSKVLFTFSANDLTRIDRVLMDRMVVIELNGYSTKEKLTIAESFLLPSALKEVNLDEKVHISHEVLEHIISGYAGEEKGVRELKRSIEGIVQKINMLRIFNTKDLPFHIPDFHLPFMVKKSHVDLFLKKKQVDTSLARLYT